MRPFDSAPNLAILWKPALVALGAFCLLIGLAVLPLAAQTRLDSSQVSAFAGAVQGAFNNTLLRDYNSAVDHGNHSTNGIASAIADCGIAYSCSIIVPPSYTTSEAVPGYQLNFNGTPLAATTPGNIAIFDQRYSDARMLVNNMGYRAGFISTPTGWLYNYYLPAQANANLSSFYLRQWSLDGGHNQYSTLLNYFDKTTWATTQLNSISHTPGQHVTLGLGGLNASLGNYTAINNLVTCYGGYSAQNDLGCHAINNTVIQGNVEYSGTLTGSPVVGAPTLTVSPTQGAHTQGAGRFLARMSSGLISGGTISRLANNSGITQVTGSGTAWPVSTVIAQLGTNVSSPGVAIVAPASFTAGSVSNIQTSSLICVADSESFEMVYPSAVTSTTFTANFAKVHPASASIAVGGLCGYLLDLTADDVTNATYPTTSQTITGTLHFAWPIMSSSSSTSANMWVTGDGGWQQIASKWNATSANGYVLYPFAEVVSTQAAGGLSDTLSLGPNNVAWSNGDTVSEFLYPAGHYLFGNTVIESYYPNITGVNGFGLKYNVPLQGNEAMMSLANNAPSSIYNANGGTLSGPFGIHLSGQINQGLTVDNPSDSAAIGIGCAAPCSTSETILAAENANYYDFFFYDAGMQRWYLSANSNSTHYFFSATQFSVPFANVLMTNDRSSNGYIQTQQLRSGTSANSDVSGELAFSSSSSATVSFQGSYASHPECSARPQFDTGATNRFWISYSATSFTINFAAPVTGTVSYSCAARN